LVGTGFIRLGVEFRGPRLARFWFAGLGDRRVRFAGNRLTWFRAQCAPSGCGSGIAELGAGPDLISEWKLCLSVVNHRTFNARFELSDAPGELALTGHLRRRHGPDQAFPFLRIRGGRRPLVRTCRQIAGWATRAPGLLTFPRNTQCRAPAEAQRAFRSRILSRES
jgi:hypothetical protein